MQIDPGPAVNIVIPPMPVRLPPPPPLVQRTNLEDTLGNGDVPLGVIAAMDRFNSTVGACARFAEDGEQAQLALRVEGSGRIARASATGAHVHEAVRLCEKLRISLTRFAGADGFISLLRRALVLARAEVPPRVSGDPQARATNASARGQARTAAA